MRRNILPVLGLLVVGLSVAAAQQAPPAPPQGAAQGATAAQPTAPGQLRPRPGTGRQPEIPPPSIMDYKPRSTLVVPEHKVPRAKFPVVDIHGHPPTFNSPEAVKNVVNLMSPLNIQVMVQTNGATGADLKTRLDAIAASGLKVRVPISITVIFFLVGTKWGAPAAQKL